MFIIEGNHKIRINPNPELHLTPVQTSAVYDIVTKIHIAFNDKSPSHSVLTPYTLRGSQMGQNKNYFTHKHAPLN